MRRNIRADRMSLFMSRQDEDALDWRENQLRSLEDVERVDRAFLAAWSSISGVWALIGLSAAGGLGVIASAAAVWHFIGR